MITSEWQITDPENGLTMPWYSHPALEEIRKWDLADKRVLEYGAGASTLWWGSKCKQVYSIEANEDWFLRINELRPPNVAVSLRSCNEGDQTKIEFYTSIPDDFIPDIVVVDGILRYECILKALTLPRPLILIVDNYMQDYVFVCPAAEEALEDFEGKHYFQPGHTDHSGRPWQTAIWHLK